MFRSLLLVLLFAFSCKEENYTKPNNPNITVIIGSSNSFGVGASYPEKSWAGLLKFETKDSIINLSTPGYSTYEFLPNDCTNNLRNIMPDKEKNIDAAIKFNPDLIIFSITTNDIGRGYSINEYLKNMDVLVNKCKSYNINYFVTSTLPRNPLSFDKRKQLHEINIGLKSNYIDNYIELYNEVTDLSTHKWNPKYCASDSVHPNDLGHYLIFTNILKKYELIKN